MALLGVPALLVALAVLWRLAPRPDDAPSPPPGLVPAASTYALLVGCTEYPNLAAALPPMTYESSVRLEGPGNDVALLRTTLCDYLGVPGDHVRVLAGWPDDPSLRPTRANILGGLERLAREVPRGGRVVFAFAGHGSQQRDQDQGDELDRLDELILPADVERWNLKLGAVPGSITDDEIRAALLRLQRAGLSVWAIFDCCHAGTMVRAGPVRTRDLSPWLLGAPETSAPERGIAPPVPEPLLSDLGGPSAGLVAFYAVQSSELAPEMTLPASLWARDRRVHGLFTFLLSRTLQRFGGGLSFRELHELVVDAYRALPYPPATPSAEGDLDLRVGSEVGAGRGALLLSREADRFALDAGSVHGLTVGSVVEAFRPGGLGAPQARVGTLSLVEVGPLSSRCRPVEGDFAADVTDLPTRLPARLLSVAPGEFRIPLGAVDDQGEPLSPQAPPPALAWALRDPVLRARFPVVEPARAAWVLRALPSDGTQTGRAARLALEPTGAGSDSLSKECDSETLEADLRALFRNLSLRRLAIAPAPHPEGVRVETFLARGPDGADAPLEAPVAVLPLDRVSARVTNATGQDLDVSVLLLEGAFEARVLFPQAGDVGRLAATDTDPLRLGPWTLSDQAQGGARLLVLCSPRGRGAAPIGAPLLEALDAARDRGPVAPAAATSSPQGRVDSTLSVGAAATGEALALAEAGWTADWGRLGIPSIYNAAAVPLEPPLTTPTDEPFAAQLPGSGWTWTRAEVVPGDGQRVDMLLMWGDQGLGIWLDVGAEAELRTRTLREVAEQAAERTLPARLSVLLGVGTRSALYLRPAGEQCDGLILEDRTRDAGADRRHVRLGDTWTSGRAFGPWLSTALLGLPEAERTRALTTLRGLARLR